MNTIFRWLLILAGVLFTTSAFGSSGVVPYAEDDQQNDYFISYNTSPPEVWTGVVGNIGAPNDGSGTATITSGIAPVYNSSYQGAFIIDSNGYLWDAYYTWVYVPPNFYHRYVWRKHTSSPCGALTGSPFTATTGSYVGAVARCTNGHIVERYLDGSGWHWIDHDTPRVLGVAVNLQGSPAYAASASYTGVLVIDNNGGVWEGAGDYATDNWVWTFRGYPESDLSVVAQGQPSLVVNSYSGYRGGLFQGTDNNAWELYVDGYEDWVWSEIGHPSSGCSFGIVSSFTMDTATSSNDLVGAALCETSSYAYGTTRLYYTSGAWHWSIGSDPYGSADYMPYVKQISGGYDILQNSYDVDYSPLGDFWHGSSLSGTWSWTQRWDNP